MKEIIEDIKNGDFEAFLGHFNDLLNLKLFDAWGYQINTRAYSSVLRLPFLTFFHFGIARKFLANKVLTRYKLEVGIRQSIARFLSTSLSFLGWLPFYKIAMWI